MTRLAIVTSHPIQYHSPWFRALAGIVDLEVLYCHQQDAAGQAAAGFGVAFEWDVPLLDGYRYAFLENESAHPGVLTFGGCDTPEVGSRLQRGKFDACLITGWYLKSYIQALWACRRLGIPALCRGDSQLATGRSPLWSAAKYIPYRLLLAQYSAHLFVGQANREYLRHYGVPEGRLFFTPHFVDSEFFASRATTARNDGSRDRLRRTLGVGPHDFVLLFVGKLIDKKRPSDFVQAVASARQSGAPVHGVVVGAGPLEASLRALSTQVGAGVSFAGFQNQSSLPAYFAAADALVLPSDAGETWGLVVNEAMSCGLPALVSDAVGCSHDLVDDGQTGYRFPVGDVAQLTRAILALRDRVIRDPEAVATAVAGKVARYSLRAAVDGVTQALDTMRRSNVAMSN